MIDASRPYRVKNMLVKKLKVENETGFLSISVVSKEDHEPISDAKVTISLYETRGIYREAATANIIATYKTDEGGKIPTVQLPVIHELDNEEENTDEYRFRVDKVGYYSVIVMNFEIFPDVTSDFNVVLNPVVTGETHIEYIIIPEKH